MKRERVLAFEGAGIPKNRIVDVVFDALTKGTPIGYSGTDRLVYEVEVDGRLRRVAITTGSNGYIIGSHPISMKTKLREHRER